jgi:hypothetical protein
VAAVHRLRRRLQINPRRIVQRTERLDRLDHTAECVLALAAAHSAQRLGRVRHPDVNTDAVIVIANFAASKLKAGHPQGPPWVKGGLQLVSDLGPLLPRQRTHVDIARLPFWPEADIARLV